MRHVREHFSTELMLLEDNLSKMLSKEAQQYAHGIAANASNHSAATATAIYSGVFEKNRYTDEQILVCVQSSVLCQGSGVNVPHSCEYIRLIFLSALGDCGRLKYVTSLLFRASTTKLFLALDLHHPSRKKPQSTHFCMTISFLSNMKSKGDDSEDSKHQCRQQPCLESPHLVHTQLLPIV